MYVYIMLIILYYLHMHDHVFEICVYQNYDISMFTPVTDGGCLGSVTPRTSDAVRKMEKQRDLVVRGQNDGDITIQRCRTSHLSVFANHDVEKVTPRVVFFLSCMG